MVLPGVAGVACGTGTTMTGTGVADEATLFCGVATPGVATTWLGALGAGTCVVCSAAGVTLVTELVTCWALVFPARVYPAAIPITAVAESPVTRIFAAVAGVLVVRRVEADLVGMVFSAVLSVVGVEGGGGGRSGSFSISRHPHLRHPHLRGLRHDLHHDVRPLHPRRHRHDVVS